MDYRKYSKYIYDEKRDYKIIEISNKLLKKNISSEDRKMIELIKTQLIDDWRAPLIEKLNELNKKYSEE